MYAQKKIITGLLVGLLCIASMPAFSLTLPLPAEQNDIVGRVETVTIKPGDTLYRIARRYDIGITHLLAANPQIKKHKLIAGEKIMIPSVFILPRAIRQGIVINLAEKRLYYYPPGENVVMIYPIGIGREGWKTPLAVTQVIEKEQWPDWNVPESIRYHTLVTKGKWLPKVVPAGPDNPLGSHAIRLELPGYLIHGTNNSQSIGKRSSSGCIRMYPEDVEELFYYADIGTPVYILHVPYKIGWYQGELYLEAHTPLPNYPWPLVDNEIRMITNNIPTVIDWDKVSNAIQEPLEVPIYIGRQK